MIVVEFLLFSLFVIVGVSFLVCYPICFIFPICSVRTNSIFSTQFFFFSIIVVQRYLCNSQIHQILNRLLNVDDFVISLLFLPFHSFLLLFEWIYNWYSSIFFFIIHFCFQSGEVINQMMIHRQYLLRQLRAACTLTTDNTHNRQKFVLMKIFHHRNTTMLLSLSQVNVHNRRTNQLLQLVK